MEIQDSTVGDVAIIQPLGSVDTRGSFDFERTVKERLAGKSRLFAVDFEQVELLTSAGIRVLVMLAKRLEGVDGRLVLYSLNKLVQTVFDISGLTQHFVIEPSKETALARLASDAGWPDSSATPLSRVSAHVMRLLGSEEPETGSGQQAARPERSREEESELYKQIAQLLTDSEPRPVVKTPEKGSQVSRLDSNVSRSGKREPR